MATKKTTTKKKTTPKIEVRKEISIKLPTEKISEYDFILLKRANNGNIICNVMDGNDGESCTYIEIKEDFLIDAIEMLKDVS